MTACEAADTPKARAISAILAIRFECERTTPRGDAVEPDVNWRNATVSPARPGSRQRFSSPDAGALVSSQRARFTASETEGSSGRGSGASTTLGRALSAMLLRRGRVTRRRPASGAYAG